MLQVLPDISNATTTALANSVDYKDAIVGIKESHIILVRDMFGNLQNHMDDIFRVTLVQVATGTLQNVVFTKVSNAVYKFEYTLMTVGDYKLDISI